jgi:hypothetical protein
MPKKLRAYRPALDAVAKRATYSTVKRPEKTHSAIRKAVP